MIRLDAQNRLPIRGFTLVELVVALAVAAILITMAYPSFRDSVKNNRQVSVNNASVGALHYARSEAVKRGHWVTLCIPCGDGAGNPTQCADPVPADALPGCVTAAACGGSCPWERGWMVFSDIDGDTLPDVVTGACVAGEDCILRVVEPAGGEVTFRNAANAIRFDASGFAAGSAGTWSLCDDRGVGGARGVEIMTTGRARTTDTGLACP